MHEASRAQPSPGEDPPTANRATATAEAVWHAWSAGALLDDLPEEARPRDVLEGHRAQEALERLAGPRVGWKLAATSAAGQAHIGVDRPLAGRLFRRFGHPSGTMLPHARLHMAVVEAELAFKMARTLDRPDVTEADVYDAIDVLMLAVEVPESRFAAFETAGEPLLLADNACAGRFVLGSEVGHWRDIDLASIQTRIEVDGTPLAEGGATNVLGHPMTALTWLVRDLASRGVPLTAGEIVMTGTTTTPVPIHPGATVRATFRKLGEVHVSFPRT